jgi:hypothetical protein
MDSSDVKNRSFLGALAAAIKAVCMLLIDALSVASEGVAMADKAVKSAREKQGIELTLSMADYATIAITKAAADQDKAIAELNMYVGDDPAKKSRVEKNVVALQKLVNEEVARIRTSRT